MIDRWAPGLGRLLRYERSWLSGDVAGGLTVGALLITQCMAYAPIAGLPPSAALRGAVIGIPLYALFGSSRHLAIGPDPGTATLAAAGLATVAVVGTDQYATAAAVLALLVGGILFVASMLRMGFLADLLSRPALVGYLAGLGITLFVSQLGKLTGVPISSDRFFARLGDFLGNLDDVQWGTVAMGVGTLVLLIVLKQVNRMTRPHDAVLGNARHLDGWVDGEAYPDAVIESGLLVYRFDAPLFFTNAARYCERVLAP